MPSHVFTDYELRQLLNQYKFSPQEEEGEDSRAYLLAKVVRNAVEEKLGENNLSVVLAESALWSEKTFPQATLLSIATHLVREAEELKSNPFDSSEMADVLLLLAHLAFRQKVNLAHAARKKLRVNQEREWGKADAEGVVEHVRETPKAQAAGL